MMVRFRMKLKIIYVSLCPSLCVYGYIYISLSIYYGCISILFWTLKIILFTMVPELRHYKIYAIQE